MPQQHRALPCVPGLASRCRPMPDDAARQLNRAVAEIDARINELVNAILHHPQFQRLEAAWRGLLYLTERAERRGGRGHQDQGAQRILARIGT